MGSVHVIVARVSICTRDGRRPLDSRLRGNDGVGTGMKTVGTRMTTEGAGMTGGTDCADVEPEGRERRETTIGRMWSRKDGRGISDMEATCRDEGNGTLRAVNLEGWRRLERGLESEQLAESDSKAWAVLNFAYREHDAGHEALAVHGVVSYR